LLAFLLSEGTFHVRASCVGLCLCFCLCRNFDNGNWRRYKHKHKHKPGMVFCAFAYPYAYRVALSFCGSLILRMGDLLCYAGTNFCDFQEVVFYLELQRSRSLSTNN